MIIIIIIIIIVTISIIIINTISIIIIIIIKIKVRREQGGSYLCIASNGHPPTVSRRLQLDVKCECKTKKVSHSMMWHDYFHLFNFLQEFQNQSNSVPVNQLQSN